MLKNISHYGQQNPYILVSWAYAADEGRNTELNNLQQVGGAKQGQRAL